MYYSTTYIDYKLQLYNLQAYKLQVKQSAKKGCEHLWEGRPSCLGGFEFKIVIDIFKRCLRKLSR